MFALLSTLNFYKKMLHFPFFEVLSFSAECLLLKETNLYSKALLKRPFKFGSKLKKGGDG